MSIVQNSLNINNEPESGLNIDNFDKKYNYTTIEKYNEMTPAERINFIKYIEYKMLKSLGF